MNTVTPEAFFAMEYLSSEEKQALITTHVINHDGGGPGGSSPPQLQAMGDKTSRVSLLWSPESGAPLRALEARDLSLIVSRLRKPKAETRLRTKDKGEVFTPAWMCNLQNNMADSPKLGPGAFNEEIAHGKDWIPTARVSFPSDYHWSAYVDEPRIELTCGEGPYLFSPHDSATGEAIPLLDDQGRFRRIGLLDRKLRVVMENAQSDEEWLFAARRALESVHGFDWQGDSLVLARLNMLATYSAYFQLRFKRELTPEERLATLELASWKLWQMDGLKLVLPESCPPTCPACAAQLLTGHRGALAVARFGAQIKTLEELYSGGEA